MEKCLKPTHLFTCPKHEKKFVESMLGKMNENEICDLCKERDGIERTNLDLETNCLYCGSTIKYRDFKNHIHQCDRKIDCDLNLGGSQPKRLVVLIDLDGKNTKTINLCCDLLWEIMDESFITIHQTKGKLKESLGNVSGLPPFRKVTIRSNREGSERWSRCNCEEKCLCNKTMFDYPEMTICKDVCFIYFISDASKDTMSKIKIFEKWLKVKESLTYDDSNDSDDGNDQDEDDDDVDDDNYGHNQDNETTQCTPLGRHFELPHLTHYRYLVTVKEQKESMKLIPFGKIIEDNVCLLQPVILESRNDILLMKSLCGFCGFLNEMILLKIDMNNSSKMFEKCIWYNARFKSLIKNPKNEHNIFIRNTIVNLTKKLCNRCVFDWASKFKSSKTKHDTSMSVDDIPLPIQDLKRQDSDSTKNLESMEIQRNGTNDTPTKKRSFNEMENMDKMKRTISSNTSLPSNIPKPIHQKRQQTINSFPSTKTSENKQTKENTEKSSSPEYPTYYIKYLKAQSKKQAKNSKNANRVGNVSVVPYSRQSNIGCLSKIMGLGVPESGLYLEQKRERFGINIIRTSLNFSTNPKDVSKSKWKTRNLVCRMFRYWIDDLDFSTFEKIYSIWSVYNNNYMTFHNKKTENTENVTLNDFTDCLSFVYCLPICELLEYNGEFDAIDTLDKCRLDIAQKQNMNPFETDEIVELAKSITKPPWVFTMVRIPSFEELRTKVQMEEQMLIMDPSVYF